MRMRWAGHAARMRRRKIQKDLVGKHEGKKKLGRISDGWEYNIKTGYKEI
jgi:hypothetical protein